MSLLFWWLARIQGCLEDGTRSSAASLTLLRGEGAQMSKRGRRMSYMLNPSSWACSPLKETLKEMSIPGILSYLSFLLEGIFMDSQVCCLGNLTSLQCTLVPEVTGAVWLQNLRFLSVVAFSIDSLVISNCAPPQTSEAFCGYPNQKVSSPPLCSKLPWDWLFKWSEVKESCKWASQGRWPWLWAFCASWDSGLHQLVFDFPLLQVGVKVTMGSFRAQALESDTPKFHFLLYNFLGGSPGTGWLKM